MHAIVQVKQDHKKKALSVKDAINSLKNILGQSNKNKIRNDNDEQNFIDHFLSSFTSIHPKHVVNFMDIVGGNYDSPPNPPDPPYKNKYIFLSVWSLRHLDELKELADQEQQKDMDRINSLNIQNNAAPKTQSRSKWNFWLALYFF